MGAGASLDTNFGFLDEGGGGERFFCHSCHRIFSLGSSSRPEDFSCPHCQSSFLEEIGGGEHDRLPVRLRAHGQLSNDQSRRITNATAMLRLLESQLREELETLQQAFANASARMNEDGPYNKQKQLTKLMTSRLRDVPVTLDMACSQPSCPICSEDFVVNVEVLRMPCSHLFHSPCVMPWLEMKQNCPICRAELTNAVPSESDLEPCSVIELRSRLRDFNCDDEDLIDKEKSDLVKLLMEKYRELHERETKAAEDAAAESADSVSLPLVLRSTSNMGRMGGFGMSLGNGSSFGRGEISDMTRLSSGPGALMLHRHAIPTSITDIDEGDEDSDDDAGGMNRVRFGIRYIPSSVTDPSQMRMPWDRPNYSSSRQFSEMFGNDDDMPSLDLATLHSGSSFARRGLPSTSVPSQSSTMIALSSPASSITYRVVPRGHGGYETIPSTATTVTASHSGSDPLSVLRDIMMSDYHDSSSLSSSSAGPATTPATATTAAASSAVRSSADGSHRSIGNSESSSTGENR